MFSEQEAKDYVTDVLGVPKDLLQNRKAKPLQFLEAVLKGAKVKLPYQTATMIARDSTW